MYVHNTWSVTLGTWAGVRVRLHIFFLLFVAVTLYLSWSSGGARPAHGLDTVALTSLAVLFAGVLCHETAHFHVCTRLGGVMHQSVLVPWGGLTSYTMPPRDHQAELIVYLAGPLANVVVCLFCTPVLLAFEQINVWGLLHPLQPAGIIEGTFWAVLLKLTFWVNWLLVLVNLIPAFPFDGGRVFRAALARLVGRRYATLVVGRLAQVAALGLVVMAWFFRDVGMGGVVPVWFALVLLAIFLFFSATQGPERRERDPSDDELFGYDFSQGYTSLERSAESVDDEPSSTIAQWLEQRRQARTQRERAQEAEEERRVDEILARLHSHGLSSLSDEDRALLQRVSARYRHRMGY